MCWSGSEIPASVKAALLTTGKPHHGRYEPVEKQNLYSSAATERKENMGEVEEIRHTRLADRTKMMMAALLVLAIFCFLPLHAEQEPAGMHAWESLFLAHFAAPAWCISFLYRPYCLRKYWRDIAVFGLVSGYELLFICWHAPCSGVSKVRGSGSAVYPLPA